MKNLGLYPNLMKELVKKNLSHVVDQVRQAGMEPYLPENIAPAYGTKSYRPGEEETFRGIEAFMSLGGDGTLLRMAALLARVDMPAFGVNFGRLGFLAEVGPEELPGAMKMLREDYYNIEERTMLHALVLKDKQVLHEAHALNDIVVTKGKISRMAHYLMRINGKKSAYLAADGIIVASATGSTAYSLSAGGPLVHPALEVMVITPICPHKLGNRPLVIPLEEVVEIETDRDGEELVLQADGNVVGPISDDCIVQIDRSPYLMQLLRVSTQNYYDSWQEKLRGEE